MPIDFIFRGAASNTGIAQRLLAANFDVGSLRPWLTADGKKAFVTVNQNGKPVNIPVANTTTTLRKDEWKQMDTALLKAALPRLRVVSDLQAAGLTYDIPNGMGKTVLEYEKQGDINDATISMDGLRLGSDDRPTYETGLLPLPIIHKDFQFSARQIQASRNGGSPLDTTMGEMCARKVAEMGEKLTLGRLSDYTFGGGTIQGMCNFTTRITKTMTDPSSTGWTAVQTLAEVLDMKQAAKAKYHYGPFVLYFSTAWDKYLDNDFNTNYPNKTLRQRLMEIDQITDVRTSDYLENYDVLLVELNPETIRIVTGMGLTTLEWPEKGGLLLNYKVMMILVPQLRADINGNTGIVHGTV